jgi:hypothetical protein
MIHPGVDAKRHSAGKRFFLFTLVKFTQGFFWRAAGGRAESNFSPRQYLWQTLKKRIFAVIGTKFLRYGIVPAQTFPPSIN